MSKKTETLRRSIESTLLVILIATLVLIFASTFGGNQAEGCAQGGAKYAARVYGETLSEGEFTGVYRLAGFDNQEIAMARAERYREHVMNGLVERELLARRADELGIQYRVEDFQRALTDQGTVMISMGIQAPEHMRSGPVPFGVRDEDDQFDGEAVQGRIQFGLRRSISEFTESQLREGLAQRMREAISASVEVSPGEVWAAYVAERERARVKYIRFSPTFYRETITVSVDEVRTWMGAHQAAVDSDYQANRPRYTGLEKQVRARHILVRLEPGVTEAEKATRRGRAQDLLRRARAGEDFLALARANSEDTETARSGGDLGFRPRGRMGTAFDEAAFGAPPGLISNVVETDRGFHVIQVVGVREGDVPEAEAKLEIAERMVREDRANTLARDTAAEALAAVRAGTAIDALEPRLGGAPPGPENPDDQPAPPENPDAPRVQETSEFGRGENPIAGADAGALARAAFSLTTEAPLPTEPMHLGNDYFVFRLESRTEALRPEFTEDVQQRISQGLLRRKQREALALYIRQLRAEAEADGAIVVNDEVLSYEDEDDASDTEDDEEEEDSEEPAPSKSG